MTPSVTISKTDGNLGVTSATDRILAVIGFAPNGPTNVATSVTNKNDLTATFGTYGQGIEAVSYMLDQGIPCVYINPTTTTSATYGSIDVSGVAGTASGFITAGSTHPGGDYDVVVNILLGGTVGTGPITFEYSLDNGENFSLPQSLGVSLTMTLDSGISFLITTAKTFVTGDTFKVSTTPPKATSSDLVTAFAALSNYSGEWLRALVCSVDATDTEMGDSILFADSFHVDGKYPEVVMNTRARHVSASESRATFQAALAAYTAAVQSPEVSVCADYCEMDSVVSGRRLRLPVSIGYTARLMTIDDSQDAAAKADGALPGVFVTTPAGDRNYHDERRFPGLDDLGYTTLRTWGGRPISPGVYVNNPRLIAGTLSDYQFFQLSAIVNRIIEEAFNLLTEKLSMSILLNDSGTIREDVAKSIESAVESELKTDFKDPGRVSDLKFSLSRTDNILVNQTLSFALNIIPLGFVKHFIGKTGLVRALPSS